MLFLGITPRVRDRHTPLRDCFAYQHHGLLHSPVPYLVAVQLQGPHRSGVSVCAQPGHCLTGMAPWFWCTTFCRENPCMGWVWVRISFKIQQVMQIWRKTVNKDNDSGIAIPTKRQITKVIKVWENAQRQNLCENQFNCSGTTYREEKQIHRAKAGVLQQEAQSWVLNGQQSYYPRRNWKELLYSHSQVVEILQFSSYVGSSEIVLAASLGEACRNTSMDSQCWMNRTYN